jgi:hypothetical protein
MKEVIEATFSAVNLIPTILFGLVVVYWIFVVIGALDINLFDFSVDSGDVDLDADVDVDVDAEADLDAEADVDTDMESEMAAQGQVEGGVAMSLNSILSFFNLGKVPFMILMSFFTLSLWVISISINYLLINQSVLLSLLFLIPNIIVSLFVAKILTTPFAFIYKKMLNNSVDTFKYQGKICTMLMDASNSKVGQGEIDYNGSIIRVNVITKKGVEIKKKETGLIINRIKEKNCYLVEPYKL